ncbi:MAG TPA: tail fiber domain-containing protein [Bacteroidales bacterium]|nr:tail fiber domain-containing protein [Bacteroidales bacterium]HPF03416.1 tail fiber domain-containing protein [Bacteroidales bacterium]HPJ60323.1 tail fiber domain-containing protein [Bacteroidales bacterium]HPR13406.1 tail fiber domain-containing protein [Bacteroidales bacterium]HRW86424.1 tail fiber domain-containing protein [Bacteroidales bacterium]
MKSKPIFFKQFAISILKFAFFLFPVTAQVPQGFNYQAIARDESGAVLSEIELPVRIGIIYGDISPTLLWMEQHIKRTNQFGLFVLMVGDPAAEKVEGKADNFSEIDWTLHPLYMSTSVYFKGVWHELGKTPLLTVPYSMVSGDIDGSLKKLAVQGTTTSMTEPLFEVRNNKGLLVFAVYNEGVRVHVADGDAKGMKGGFAVGGFGTEKEGEQEYLRVTSDSTRIYVNNYPAKGLKGGFAVGGFDATKAATGNFIDMTPENYFIGHQAGVATKPELGGKFNLFLGYNSGMKNTTGHNNLFFGYMAGYTNSIGTYNVFVGPEAGKLSNANYNTFVGYNSGSQTTTGGYNAMFGYTAGSANTTGVNNAYFGYAAGSANTGTFNTCLGAEAGYYSGSGSNNVFVGIGAGRHATGSGNIFVGKFAGYSETGSSKLVIENTENHLQDNRTNALIYGDFNENTLRLNARIGINTDATSNMFYADDTRPSDDNPAVAGRDYVTPYYGVGVSGVGGFKGVVGEATLAGSGYRYGVYGHATGGATNYGVYGIASGGVSYAGYFAGNVYVTGTLSQNSDKSLKKNIFPLSGAMEKINNLQGVSYEWKSDQELDQLNLIKSSNRKADDPRHFNFPSGKQIGLIAQDVEKVIPELVMTDPEGIKSVDYIKMVPLLIEAIKEQQKQIESQNRKIEQLYGLIEQVQEK